MPDFDNWNDLLNFISNSSNDVLEKDVSLTVKNAISYEAYNIVYEAYIPRKYQRTYGLANNIEIDMVTDSSGTEMIAWVNEFDDGSSGFPNREGTYIPEVVEYGHWESTIGYAKPFLGKGHRLAAYAKPRPFIEEAYNFIMETESHITAYIDGMASRGIDVE